MSVHGMTFEELDALEEEAIGKAAAIRARQAARRAELGPQIAELELEKAHLARQAGEFTLPDRRDNNPTQTLLRDTYNRKQLVPKLEAVRSKLYALKGACDEGSDLLHDLTFTISQVSIWKGGLGAKLWAEGAAVAAVRAAGVPPAERPRTISKTIAAAGGMVRVDDGAGRLFSFNQEDAQAYIKANPAAFIAPPRRPASAPEQPPILARFGVEA